MIDPRTLTDQEIGQLMDQGCTCTDWSNVTVSPQFDAATVSQTALSGKIELGHFDKVVRIWPGVVHAAGIFNATLHNCRVGNHTLIRNVGSCLSNLDIADEVIIDQVNLIATTEETSFGNGVEVAAVNEAGGREVPIYDRLSAQTAYLIAFYRHRPQLIANLKAMIASYAAQVQSERGTIGRGARLVNCDTLINCRIGPDANLEQVTRLENGTVNSRSDAPTTVGPGVIARDFIMTDGALVTDGTVLDHCFVGQGVRLKQFNAEHCLFFANCEAYLGEACAVFAGPYTVTHHKSSLLIAAYTSFMNAGSATNQSNHMYRLGPVHQGILERGCKTGSGAYVCFPAHIGAFSFIKGQHYHHPDSQMFPFSYLVEDDSHTRLHPGAALGTVGLQRDLDKWPQRDRRNEDGRLDWIHFDGLGPYVGQQIVVALEILKIDANHYATLKISTSARQRGIELYQTALDLILARSVKARLTERPCQTLADLRQAMHPAVPTACEKWADLAGLYAPQELLADLVQDLEDGHLNSLTQLDENWATLHSQYPLWRWAWAAAILQERLEKPWEDLALQDVIDLLQKGQKAEALLARLQKMDAQRDVGKEAQIGYGLNGDNVIQKQDFKAVRGDNQEFQGPSTDWDDWIGRLKDLGSTQAL